MEQNATEGDASCAQSVDGSSKVKSIERSSPGPGVCVRGGPPNTHPPHTTLIYKHTRRNAKLQLEVRARHTGGPHTWPARRRRTAHDRAVCGTPNTIIQARSAEGAPSLAPSQYTVSPAQVQVRHALETSESRRVPHPALAISPLHAICVMAILHPSSLSELSGSCSCAPRSRRTCQTCLHAHAAPPYTVHPSERHAARQTRTRRTSNGTHHAAPATSLRSRRSAILIVAATAAPTSSVTPATDVASSLKGSC